ncbi:MAG: glycine zipper family protein [Betaproteobacteria bacterium]|jgi:hypothetical protein
MIKKILHLITLTILVGCANTGSNFKPIIDQKGINMVVYENDLTDCQALSTDTSSAGKKAAMGATGAAAVGALVGVITGDSGKAALQGAGIGAIVGGLSGGAGGMKEQESIIRKCLAGRGYRVLN